MCLDAREAQDLETSLKGTNENCTESPEEQKRRLKLSISRKVKLQSAEVKSYNQPMAEDILYPRFAERRLTEALEDSPVVLIQGPRQCGKTTLAQMVCTSEIMDKGKHPSIP